MRIIIVRVENLLQTCLYRRDNQIFSYEISAFIEKEIFKMCHPIDDYFDNHQAKQLL